MELVQDREQKEIHLMLRDTTKHLVVDCPHRKVEDANMTIHLTLVAGTGSAEQNQMLGGTLRKGTLDTACKRYVVLNGWTNIYLCFQ